jgi:hypothetical protein
MFLLQVLFGKIVDDGRMKKYSDKSKDTEPNVTTDNAKDKFE